jgi:hypothetical protein
MVDYLSLRKNSAQAMDIIRVNSNDNLSGYDAFISAPSMLRKK